MASSTTLRRYSKSQMYFFKIIKIISSIPPSNKNRFPFDLNLTFSSITQEDSESSIKTTTNNNDEIRQQQEQEHEHEQEQEQEQEEPEEKVVDQEKNVDDVATELENENDVKTKTTSSPRGDCNCFDLLIEAARVVSEKNKESESDSAEEKESGTELIMTRSRCKENEREPVVRSKRGRNQLLPCRFRDSVVEPLKRTGRNKRLSFTTNAKKRLLR